MDGEKAMKEVLIFKQQKKWPELVNAADRAFSKWYTVDPTTIPIHWYRGTANFILGKQDIALQDFLKAEKFTPYNHYIQNDLGTCYQKIGQTDLARTHYKESVRISNMFDDPRVNLVVSYYNNREYEEAFGWTRYLQNKELKMKYQQLILEKQD